MGHERSTVVRIAVRLGLQTGYCSRRDETGAYDLVRTPRWRAPAKISPPYRLVTKDRV